MSYLDTFSAQTIRKARSGGSSEYPDLGFSPEDYSRFKFGCKDVARKFGYELGDKFAEAIAQDKRFHNKQIVVASSAYTHVPTACFAMKDYFVQRINQYLVKVGFPVVQETKISRTATYSKEYGSMSAEKRRELLKDDKMHIDSVFVKGKILILMDDIRVTGAHEELMQRMIDSYKLECEWVFMYYAEIVDTSIDPKYEDYLNYYYVKSLLHLDKIIKNENFLLNTRTVKYILRASKEEFIPFISYQQKKFVNNLYHQAIGNSYHVLMEYKDNLEFIRQLIYHNEHNS